MSIPVGAILLAQYPKKCQSELGAAGILALLAQRVRRPGAQRA